MPIVDDPWWRSRDPRRSLDPRAVSVLRRARASRGWSLEEAARRAGISGCYLSRLERGLRAPSTAVAQSLVTAYFLSGVDRSTLLDAALPLVGRSSPYRTGKYPAQRPPALS